jgi:hypothetical protein
LEFNALALEEFYPLLFGYEGNWVNVRRRALRKAFPNRVWERVKNLFRKGKEIRFFQKIGFLDGLKISAIQHTHPL